MLAESTSAFTAYWNLQNLKYQGTSHKRHPINRKSHKKKYKLTYRGKRDGGRCAQWASSCLPITTQPHICPYCNGKVMQ